MGVNGISSVVLQALENYISEPDISKLWHVKPKLSARPDTTRVEKQYLFFVIWVDFNIIQMVLFFSFIPGWGD